MGRKTGPVLARTWLLHNAVRITQYGRFTLSFVRRGGARMHTGQGIEDVAAGDVVLINQDATYRCSPRDSAVLTTVSLAPEYLREQFAWHRRAEPDASIAICEDLATRSRDMVIVRLGLRDLLTLAPCLDELVRISGAHQGQFFRIQLLWFRVLDELTRRVADRRLVDNGDHHFPTPTSAATGTVRTEVLQAIGLLEASLDKSWRSDELAAAVHLSSSQLARLFAREIGLAPMSYLARRRTQRMADLLRHTNLTVRDAAASVGWNDPDYAARRFRAQFGLTPSRYRRIVRNLMTGA
ncbi:hypothetical protein GCM10009788_23860 [Nocardioides humi]|uniref:HTH araC/xylS-type domain-containing protein n=2 Tax=Nocardioides humi TaxID=449461 RepID=A0ABN2AJU1_9ACTN